MRIQVTWGAENSGSVPVHVDVPECVDREAMTGLWCRVDGNREPVLTQHDPVNSRRIWWLAHKPEKGVVAEYDLSIFAPPASGSMVEYTDDASALTVTVSGEPVLTYCHAPVPPPTGKSPFYERSGFIHPLYSPSGQILSSIHPPDHVHHLGIWSPWTSTEFEGKHVDFWNLKGGQGTVRFAGFRNTFAGPVFGGFLAEHEHVAFGADRSEKVALNEIWDVRVWNLTDRRLIDFTTTQSCASDSPLVLNAYRYGGFGFRGRLGWGGNNSDYLTSEGKTRADGHSTRARWCHAYGTSDDGPAGVLFMSHPENREHPEPMRLWPAGMNKGKDNMFFNFCPIQKKPWTLEPGRNYTLRYRMCVYDGKPDGMDAEALWQGFAHPPKVEIVQP